MIKPEIVQPRSWKSPSGYSHAMSVTGGRIIVTAGQIGWNPRTGQIETDDFVAQTAQALRNVVEVLEVAGARPEHIVRLTWYITDRKEYLDAADRVGQVYREIVGRHYPAMSVVVVKALLELRASVEIEATAVVP
jgi:enamine deaminase RidA (YjgF/YER057c/UK114 family)